MHATNNEYKHAYDAQLATGKFFKTGNSVALVVYSPNEHKLVFSYVDQLPA